MNTWKNNNMLRESVDNKESLLNYCKNYIIDTLPEYEGQQVYGCDLGSYITEGPNADGSLTYSREEAKQYILNWWDEVADYYEYAKTNFGGPVNNPFENPEAFMVEMVINGVDSILAHVKVVNDNWNDELELTPEVIGEITSDVENFEGYDGYGSFAF